MTAETRNPVPLPAETDAQLARQSREVLSAWLQAEQLPLLKLIAADGSEQSVELPPAALSLLLEVLTPMARGEAIAITPIRAELTTQQAADFLNVSRPYLIKLLENGKIPFSKVGTHRRIRYEAVRDYKQQIDRDRSTALDELAAQAQELGLGYECD